MRSKRIDPSRLSPWRLVPLVLACLATVQAGCLRQGADVQISDRRTADFPPPDARLGMSSGERFGREDSPSGAAPGRGASPSDFDFQFELPEGWTELTANSMRLVNLQPAGNPDATCSVSVFGGDGGGLAANLHRWRKQMGMPVVPDAELLALPKVLLLGNEATFLELVGTFSGMSGDARPDWGLLGVVLSTPRATVFVKMTAPGAVAQSEKENFLAFVSSLRVGAARKPAAPAEAPRDEKPERAANAYRFELPEGWKDAGPRTMRALNFRVGEGTECYLVVLSGDGGGLAANLNRWQGQVGQARLSAEEIDALPKVELMGEPAHMLEVSGSFTGMDGRTSEDMTLLGLAVIRESDALFLKMVGPKAEVAAQREGFVSFAESLEASP